MAAAVTLPFFLWSPRGFWHSVVALQLYQPFRPGALSFLAWWASRGHPQLSASLSFVAAGSRAWSGPADAADAGGIRRGGRAHLLRVLCLQQTGVLQLLLLRHRRAVPTAAAWRPSSRRPVTDRAASTSTGARPVAYALLAGVCLLPLLWPGDARSSTTSRCSSPGRWGPTGQARSPSWASSAPTVSPTGRFRHGSTRCSSRSRAISSSLPGCTPR